MTTDLFCPIVYKPKLTHREWPDDYVNHLICGDCVQIMSTMPDVCVDLVITSPPYFLAKSYEKDWTWQKYLDLMDNVFKQVHRVLKPGKYFVVNFGDYFNSGNRFYDADVPSVYPATINYFEWGRKNQFDLQATRIWRKNFARMSIPFVCNDHPRPVFDYEHIWTFRRKNGSNQEVVMDRKLSQRGVVGEHWRQPAELGNHEASFPLDLPLWAIDVYSANKSDIVLDPFSGAGTTMLACVERERPCIGIELSGEHCETAYGKMSTS
jgi:DNA modification methylase